MSESEHAAWQAFCEALSTLPQRVIDRDGAPRTDLETAEGYRYLARQIRIGLEDYVEYRNPANPRFYSFTTPTRKTGIDNPDTIYLTSAVSPDHAYRVHGNVGTITYIGFGLYAGFYGATGGLRTVSHYNTDDFQIGDDGSFEIFLSAERRAGNWIQLTEDSRRFDVRQTYLDVSGAEHAGSVSIEILDTAPDTSASLGDVLTGLREAAEYLGRGLPMWADFVQTLQESPDSLTAVTRQEASDLLSNMDTHYASGYWALDGDDALVIDICVPECRYWSFQIANHWMESFDDRRTVINMHTAVTDDPHRVRVVLSASDPGSANWLRTDPYTCGTMTLRYILAEAAPTFSSRRMPVGAVQNASWSNPSSADGSC